MEDLLLAIAKRFWPDLEQLRGRERSAAAVDVVGFLYAAPLAVAGLAWLLAATDWTRLRAEWVLMGLFFLLLQLIKRYSFFVFISVAPGAHFDWIDDLGPVIIWSAALIVGPSGLWLSVLDAALFYTQWWRTRTSARSRLNCVRNLAFILASQVTAKLIALSLYQRWGGAFPLPGLAVGEVPPAFYATFAGWLLTALLWLPLLTFRPRSGPGDGIPRVLMLRFWAMVVGADIAVRPFGILAAGLYVEHGLGGYLFLFAGLFLASVLAHQLGQAAERSRQRSDELEKLEHLGRGLLAASPDASDLPDVLREHVEDMFPHGRIEIRMYPEQVVLRHPEDQPPVTDSAWEWLRTHPQANSFLPGQALPWLGQASSSPVVFAPILDVATDEPIGAIFLSGRHESMLPVASMLPAALPAVQSLAAQIASVRHRVQIYQQTLAHQRVEQELALAGQVQASFLPRHLPQVPGWQLAATLHPAKETSGDFYDVICLPRGRLGILVADVADKGMGAALYMALSRTLVRTYAREYPERPESVLGAANRRILSDAHADLFVSAFYGVLDAATATLTYASAGHNPPFLLRAQDSDTVQTLRKTGMVLGVVEDAAWKQETVQLAPGDLLLLYTDGVTEAQDAEGSFFGPQRLLETARSNSGRPAGAVQDAVLAEVRRFVGGAPQFDDITVMVVVRDDKAPKAS
jgi:serine phosphatase RsbU (regulator of sigma subunit)